ncbi:F-box domain-containing protein [Xylariaceae sp. FL1272]|nr:F-box domain-containing protein [Xylariaceae sp. FL1272]
MFLRTCTLDTALSIDQHSCHMLATKILISALESFSTRSLLPVAAVSRRFRGLVDRLVQATLLKEHELILECYHPSNKISTPYLFCKYLGTDGLSDAGTEPELDYLNQIYSRFEPFHGEEQRRPRLRWPINRTANSEAQEISAEAPSQDVHLEAGEPFSQLCTLINLVIGPRRGLFLSIVNVTDGVIRIWREWLQEQATRPQMGEQPSEGIHDSSILWTDSSRNVGLRLRVLQKENRHMPVLLVCPNDDHPVSYALEFQELIVRTNQLVLSLETSIAQQVSHHGKAIVIASM